MKTDEYRHSAQQKIFDFHYATSAHNYLKKAFESPQIPCFSRLAKNCGTNPFPARQSLVKI